MSLKEKYNQRSNPPQSAWPSRVARLKNDRALICLRWRPDVCRYHAVSAWYCFCANFFHNITVLHRQNLHIFGFYFWPSVLGANISSFLRIQKFICLMTVIRSWKLQLCFSRMSVLIFYTMGWKSKDLHTFHRLSFTDMVVKQIKYKSKTKTSFRILSRT